MQQSWSNRLQWNDGNPASCRSEHRTLRDLLYQNKIRNFGGKFQAPQKLIDIEFLPL